MIEYKGNDKTLYTHTNKPNTDDQKKNRALSFDLPSEEIYKSTPAIAVKYQGKQYSVPAIRWLPPVLQMKIR